MSRPATLRRLTGPAAMPREPRRHAEMACLAVVRRLLPCRIETRSRDAIRGWATILKDLGGTPSAAGRGRRGVQNGTGRAAMTADGSTAQQQVDRQAHASGPTAWTRSRAAPPSAPTSRSPACCIGKVLRSPHPHARIKSINFDKALALPGVKAVMTGKDLVDFPGTSRPSSASRTCASTAAT